MMQFFRKDIQSLRKMLDEKQISAEELTAYYIDRIKSIDPTINSYITSTFDGALENAKAAQKRIDEGTAAILTGIPIAVKDNICTKGVTTTAASKMLEGFTPPYDATVIQKLKQQYPVFLGKTNMDEFAMGGSGETSYFGPTKNPYDTEYVTGGSSSGSAAAVSAGLCAAAIGSDTGGSIRQPASMCGVTGLKPAYGSVSRYGLIAFASSLDQIGPIGRSAKDCGALLQALVGYDPMDGTSKNYKYTDNYLSECGSSVKGKKLAVIKEFMDKDVDSDVRSAIESAITFYKENGAEIEEVSLSGLQSAVAAYYLISSAEASSNLSRYDGIKFGYRSENYSDYEELIRNTRKEGFGEEVKRRILLGTYALSSGYFDAYYKKAVFIRNKFKAEYQNLFKTYDAVLTPTSPFPAYKIGSKVNDPVSMYLADICTITVNLAGLPAISTPCGYTKENLPIGLSIIGNVFEEAKIIGLADCFEQNFTSQDNSFTAKGEDVCIPQ